jgi:hypothetical protein
MKKVLFLLLFIAALVSSCTKDESLDPRSEIVVGQYIKLDIIDPAIYASDLPNSSFKGIISAPANNVDKFELFVAKRDAFGFVSDFVLYETITSFPHELTVNATKLAIAGIPVIANSDFLRFYGKSYKGDVVADYSSLSSSIKSLKSMKQGYRFIVPVIQDISELPENQYGW